jgi:hypothetical protein
VALAAPRRRPAPPGRPDAARSGDVAERTRIRSPPVSAEPASSSNRPRPAEAVGGFLAVVSIAASIVSLFWHPLRLSPIAVLIALITVGMSPKNSRLPLAAVVIGAICFVAGMTIAVTTKNPIY